MSQQHSEQAPVTRKDTVAQLVGIAVLALFATVALVAAHDEHGFERVMLAIAAVPLTIAAMTQIVDSLGAIRRRKGAGK